MTWPGVALWRKTQTCFPSATMRSPAGSLKVIASLFGLRCCSSPFEVSDDPVIGFVSVCSNVARSVLTRDQAPIARVIVASTS